MCNNTIICHVLPLIQYKTQKIKYYKILLCNNTIMCHVLPQGECLPLPQLHDSQRQDHEVQAHQRHHEHRPPPGRHTRRQVEQDSRFDLVRAILSADANFVEDFVPVSALLWR